MSRDRRSLPTPSRQILRYALCGLQFLPTLLLLSGTAVAASGTTGVSIRITGLPLAFGPAAQKVEVPAIAVVNRAEAAIQGKAPFARATEVRTASATVAFGSSVLAPLPANIPVGETDSDVLVLLSWE